MSDEFFIPRQLREANVFVPGVGPLSVFDLAAAGIVAVQSRADAAEAEQEAPPPALTPPISADTGEPDQLDKMTAMVEALNDKLQDVENEDRQQAILDRLDMLERREAALEARNEAISAALDEDDVEALAQLTGDPDMFEEK